MKFTFCNILITLLTTFILAGFSFAQSERERGIEFYESGDYKAAMETLQRVTLLDENDVEAWRFLAMAYARTNDKKQARKAFNKVKDWRDEALNKSYNTPVKILTKRPARYTEEARRNGITGTIKLAVEFGKDGQIKFVFPINELSYGLTENAVKTASEMKFEPAVKNDKTVTAIKIVSYSFEIY